MVSFEPAAALQHSPRPPVPDSSKKRKSEELFLPSHPGKSGGSFLDKRSKAESSRPSVSGMGLQLIETSPLPSEWQRCLDIQSGQIHFYNVRTEKRTFDDPRRSPRSRPPVLGDHMSLELQLNLPCDSDDDHDHHNFGVSSSDHHNNLAAAKQSFPSWLAVEEEEQQQQQEMMATVCMKCHMLVMLCKSSPACPNCKFMHPLDQPPPNLFKPSLTLLC